jgi:hypothetical protein
MTDTLWKMERESERLSSLRVVSSLSFSSMDRRGSNLEVT